MTVAICQSPPHACSTADCITQRSAGAKGEQDCNSATRAHRGRGGSGQGLSRWWPSENSGVGGPRCSIAASVGTDVQNAWLLVETGPQRRQGAPVFLLTMIACAICW
jgi:hypothetical protein